MNARLIRAVRLSQQRQLVSRSCPAHFSGARYNERQIRLATSADQSAHATDSPTHLQARQGQENHLHQVSFGFSPTSKDAFLTNNGDLLER